MEDSALLPLIFGCSLLADKLLSRLNRDRILWFYRLGVDTFDMCLYICTCVVHVVTARTRSRMAYFYSKLDAAMAYSWNLPWGKGENYMLHGPLLSARVGIKALHVDVAIHAVT